MIRFFQPIPNLARTELSFAAGFNSFKNKSQEAITTIKIAEGIGSFR